MSISTIIPSNVRTGIPQYINHVVEIVRNLHHLAKRLPLLTDASLFPKLACQVALYHDRKKFVTSAAFIYSTSFHPGLHLQRKCVRTFGTPCLSTRSSTKSTDNVVSIDFAQSFHASEDTSLIPVVHVLTRRCVRLCEQFVPFARNGPSVSFLDTHTSKGLY